MKNYSDEQLIRAYLKGDQIALEVLIKRYLNPIYGFVFKYAKNQQSAEDITQETFIKVWKNIKKFQKNKSFKAWIYTIAKNTALDYFKKKNPVLFSRFAQIDGKNPFIENIKDPTKLPDKVAEEKNIKEILDNAMGKLSSKYYSVLSLYYNNSLNLREIAEKLGESINTIKSRHRRGLILLREVVAEL